MRSYLHFKDDIVDLTISVVISCAADSGFSLANNYQEMQQQSGASNVSDNYFQV